MDSKKLIVAVAALALLCGVQAADAQVVTAYYAPSYSYYAPAPTVAYYAPTVAYSPVATAAYYAPAAPVTTYYAPSVPVTTYYAPSVSVPVRTYYAGPMVYRVPRRVARRYWAWGY